MSKQETNRIFAKVLAIVLATLFIFSMVGIVLFNSFAKDSDGDGVEDYVFDELETEEPESLKPIPFLCILISFDANGNGIDDYDPEHPKKLYDEANKNEDFYGEQWIHSDASYWNKILFGSDFKSLANYYSELTNDKFYFTPAKETEGTPDDGVIHVVVNMKHPRATLSSFTTDAGEKKAAIKAADPYIDFSQYDKDGNGYVDYDELALTFVLAGYEYAYNTGSRPSSQNAFGTHAHYTSGGGYLHDGVVVCGSGHMGYTKCGEYMSSTQPITMGTIAHEICHYLGAADLYDSDGKWTYAVGSMTLMGSGNHNGSPSGTCPAYLDPYQYCMLGFGKYDIANDGTYTLYSRESTKGNYNILRVSTPNPSEFYLIENRYASSGNSQFDITTSNGIVIWHIDEASFNRGKVNGSKSGHDIGVAIMAPNGISANSCAYAYDPDMVNSTKYQFDSQKSGYRFPLSDTWYTSLTEEEAASFHLVVDIVSKAGAEMEIKISGTPTCAPTVKADNSHITEITDNSIKVYSKIVDLCGGNVTSCGVIISKKSDPTPENGTVIYTKPNKDGSFSAEFVGLEQGTKYYIKAFATGSQGTGSYTFTTYTKFPPKEEVEHDYYNVYLYSNYNNLARKYTIYVYPGQTIDYKIAYEWAGYTFCGWYWDAALTERYDMSYTQDTKDNFSLYGKWVKNAEAMTLKLVGLNKDEIIYNFASEIGDTYRVPTIAERENDPFEGWYLDEGYTLLYDFDNAVTEEQLTLYAKFASTEVKRPEVSTNEGTTATEITEQTQGTTDEPVKPTGCGSVIGTVFAGTGAVALITCVYVIRKKKENQ